MRTAAGSRAFRSSRRSLVSRHVVVVDLGFGDAGKGGIVDYLAAPAGPAARAGTSVRAVVRFNGGAQAAHNVVRSDGRWHTFAQFGAATLHGVPTLLSRHMMVEPLALAAEAAALARLGVRNPFGLLRIDGDALLTTPWHAAVNRAREVARGAAAHGSCGVGIGETAAYALAHPENAPRVGDTGDPGRLTRLLVRLAEWAEAEISALRAGGPAAGEVEAAGSASPHAAAPAIPQVREVAEVYRAFARRVRPVDGTSLLRRLACAGPVLFEGAQGVLLDENHGFHPHTTWSTTTPARALGLLAEAGVDVADRDQVSRLGVTRPYLTRHGAGPLVTEDPVLAAVLPEPHNGTGRWQGAFRRGHLDLVALRYAVGACASPGSGPGVDALAVTHLDTAARPAARGLLRAADAWRRPDGRTVTGLPVGRAPDLAHQERLTALARSAVPVLGPLPGDVAGLLAGQLGVPVAVRSMGPTWADKQDAAPADRRTVA